MEYDGTKSLYSYSMPFHLRKFPPERWLIAEDLGFLVDALEASRHFPIATKKAKLRRPSPVEIRAFNLTEERDLRRRKQ